MKVLIADDNKEFSSTLADIVQSFGFDTYMVHEPDEAISYIDKFNRQLGVALLDIEFGPGIDKTGLDILEFSRRNYPSLPVVMISGKGSIETAVKATKLGAINFIEKSIVSKEKIKEVLDSAMERIGVQGEENEIKRFLELHGIISRSKAMLDVGDSIIRFGRTDLNVLITGETGTGKKLVAKAIHAISRRGKSPFVTVDIPNIPRDLFQSELFGHNKGAFSGATETKKGLFHQANKGTLFLDEIGDMTLDLQANLFIPIEEKVVRRVGSVQSEDVDIRFVSATDKDLVSAMKESKFREQLYHRLRECGIHLPPLRERKVDIPDIVDYYVKKHNQEFEDNKLISPSAIEFLQEQEWPGNVRELASAIRVALQTTHKEEVEVADLDKLVKVNHGSIPSRQPDAIINSGRTLKEDLERVDMKKIEATLKKCNGNVSKSAALLGISRETLHNKIRKYEIDVQAFRMKARM